MSVFRSLRVGNCVVGNAVVSGCSGVCAESGPGIAIAVGLSILNVFRQAWWPYSTTLGSIPGVPGYHDTSTNADAELVDDVVIFRFDAPLIFVNARSFRSHVESFVNVARPPRWIIVAAEPMTDVDTTAASMLGELVDSLRDRGVVMVFAEMKDPVQEKIRRYGLYDTIGAGNFFPTNKSAVEAIRAVGNAEEL